MAVNISDCDAKKATLGMPATVDSIRDDLMALGVSRGMVLLVHSSLSSLGWVCGGRGGRARPRGSARARRDADDAYVFERSVRTVVLDASARA